MGSNGANLWEIFKELVDFFFCYSMVPHHRRKRPSQIVLEVSAQDASVSILDPSMALGIITNYS